MTSRTGRAWEAQGKLEVAGWGLGAQHMPHDVFVHGRRVRFPNAVSDFHARLLTLHELSMLSLMNILTDKSSWEIRIFHSNAVERWRLELLKSPWAPDGLNVSAEAFDYCIDELREKAKNLDTTNTVEVLETPDASVVKSDRATTKGLREEMKVAVGAIDWPTIQEETRTEGTRVLLIDPSLYLGKHFSSRVLTSGKLHRSSAVDQCYKGVYWYASSYEGLEYKDGSKRNLYMNVPSEEFWSETRQWLPTDVTWRQGGRSKIAKIESYINNLHPSCNELYTLIERSITESIPLWDRVLSSLDDERPRRVEPWSFRAHTPTPPPGLDPDQDDFMEWRGTHRCITGPEPGVYVRRGKRPARSAINLTEDFPDGIQVIVKLESIELTPERPQLDATDWKVEGMLNEHICASSIFFYDSENVSGGGLEFRQRSEAEEFYHLTMDCGYLELARILGIEHDDDAYQYLGRVSTPEGRLLAFPNVLHTRTPALRLEDASKPGHCRFLTVLLVDPYIRILSTANVTPRQRDWWAGALHPDPRHRLGLLPPELFNHVVDYSGWLTSPRQARVDKDERDAELAMFQNALNNRVQVFDLAELEPY